VGTPLNSPADKYVGNRGSIVVDVKGKGDITINVPFMSMTPWRYTYPEYVDFDNTTPWNLQNAVPHLQLMASDITLAGTNSNALVIYGYVSAGPDFVFDSLQQPKSYPGSFQGQCDVTGLAQKAQPFPGYKLPSAIPWTLTVEDVLKRWSSRGEGLAYIDSRNISFIPGDKYGHFDLLNLLFKYNAGGMRRRVFSTTSVGETKYYLSCVTPDFADELIEQPSAAMAGSNNGKWPIVDFSVPYISYLEVDVHPDFYQLLNYTDNYESMASSTNGATLIDQWVKAAYNFQLMLLVPTRPLRVWPWVFNQTSHRKVRNRSGKVGGNSKQKQKDKTR